MLAHGGMRSSSDCFWRENQVIFSLISTWSRFISPLRLEALLLWPQVVLLVVGRVVNGVWCGVSVFSGVAKGKRAVTHCPLNLRAYVRYMYIVLNSVHMQFSF